MVESKRITDKNLDLLADFLTRELEQPNLTEQIPDGAQIFHGSYNDTDLTQTNLKRAMRMLVGMALGFLEESPLMMIFEYRPGQQMVIDLSSEEQKREIDIFIEAFQAKSQQHIAVTINKMVEA